MTRVRGVAFVVLLGCVSPAPSSDPPTPSTQPHVFVRESPVASDSPILRGHLRVSTAAWSDDEMSRFCAIDPRAPIFVLVEPGSITPVRECSGAGHYRYTAEPPFAVSWTWDHTEARANDPVHADAIQGSFAVQLVAAGSYWIDDIDLAALRHAPGCRATHVVAALRVGRPGRSDDGCNHGDSGPGADCNLPLTLDLIALDPFAPLVDFCPPPTRWDEWSCRMPGSPPPDGIPDCTLVSPAHPACWAKWPARSGWEGARPGHVPDKLAANDIRLGFAPIEQRLHACVADGESVHLRLSVEGPTGAVIQVEVDGEEATARCLAELSFTARFPTFARSVQGIERTFTAP